MTLLKKSIAHIREDDDVIQTVEEHLIDVKELAERYGDKIGVKHIAGLAGLLHDVGKYSHEFVEYIEAAVYNPQNAPPRGSVDHSTAGGKILYELFHKRNKNRLKKLLTEIVGNAIISHHSYLHDYLSPNLNTPFAKRVNKDISEFYYVKELFFQQVMSEKSLNRYVRNAMTELNNFLKGIKQENLKFYIMFLTKYIFS